MGLGRGKGWEGKGQGMGMGKRKGKGEKGSGGQRRGKREEIKEGQSEPPNCQNPDCSRVVSSLKCVLFPGERRANVNIHPSRSLSR